MFYALPVKFHICLLQTYSYLSNWKKKLCNWHFSPSDDDRLWLVELILLLGLQVFKCLLWISFRWISDHTERRVPRQSAGMSVDSSHVVWSREQPQDWSPPTCNYQGIGTYTSTSNHRQSVINQRNVLFCSEPKLFVFWLLLENECSKMTFMIPCFHLPVYFSADCL